MPASATSALQVHVHALRQTIGRDRIVTRSPGYVLRVDADELDIDLSTFDAGGIPQIPLIEIIP